MTVMVGELYMCDGWRLVLVVAIEEDGMSEDTVLVRWENIDFWCHKQRLEPLASDLLP